MIPGHVYEGIPGLPSDRVFCDFLPARVDAIASYTLELAYSADEGEREITIKLWVEDSLLSQDQVTVPAGSGVAYLTIDTAAALPEGYDYKILASIDPTSAGESYNLDTCFNNLIVAKMIPVTDLKISPALKSRQPGETWQLILFVFPANASDPVITWRSADEVVFTVDSDGLVTAVSEWMATIIATTSDDAFSAQGAIVVSPAQIGLIQNPDFENGQLNPCTSYGEISLDTEYAHTRAYGISVSGVGAVEQLISIEPNTTYQLSGSAKVLAEGQQVYFGIKDHEDDAEVYTDVKITELSYSEVSLTFKSGPSNSTAIVYYYVEGSGYKALGDDFELVKVE